jgi:hypothetical protein
MDYEYISGYLTTCYVVEYMCDIRAYSRLISMTLKHRPGIIILHGSSIHRVVDRQTLEAGSLPYTPVLSKGFITFGLGQPRLSGGTPQSLALATTARIQEPIELVIPSLARRQYITATALPIQ